MLRSYQADPRTTEEFETRKTAVRGLSIGAGALGAAALGLGVGAAVTGTW